MWWVYKGNDHQVLQRWGGSSPAAAIASQLLYQLNYSISGSRCSKCSGQSNDFGWWCYKKFSFTGALARQGSLPRLNFACFVLWSPARPKRWARVYLYSAVALSADVLPILYPFISIWSISASFQRLLPGFQLIVQVFIITSYSNEIRCQTLPKSSAANSTRRLSFYPIENSEKWVIRLKRNDRLVWMLYKNGAWIESNEKFRVWKWHSFAIRYCPIFSNINLGLFWKPFFFLIERRLLLSTSRPDLHTLTVQYP